MALAGKTAEEKIWNFLKGKGLSNQAAAGLMGNLYAESGLSSTNLQNTYNRKLGFDDAAYTQAVDNGTYNNFVKDSAGYGLAQWTYHTRKQNLLNFAKEKKKSIGDLEMQLEFLFKELTGNYKGVYNCLLTAKTILEASNVILLKYERPADQSQAMQAKRAKFGQVYYDRYANKGDEKNMKILLISGHGAGDSGAVAKINGVTYKEAEENIKMVELIHAQLCRYATVDYYPIDRNAYQDVQQGKVQVDFSKYDYVLEIHFNACVKDLIGNGQTTGTEIYVTKADNTIKVEQEIVNAIAAVGFKNRGVRKANYAVINKVYKASVESALVEICFIDDADDMKVYVNNRDKIADAITNAIVRAYNLGSREQQTTASQNATQSHTATQNSNPTAGSTYTLKKNYPGYTTANDARSGKNKKTVVKAGTYYMYKVYNGMLNVSKDKTKPGAWINPNA